MDQSRWQTFEMHFAENAFACVEECAMKCDVKTI